MKSNLVPVRTYKMPQWLKPLVSIAKAGRANPMIHHGDDQTYARVLAAQECWIWQGDFDASGRPLTPCGKSAYRAVFHAMVGMMNRRHTIDHLCYNKRCVNPAHLEEVVESVNLERDLRKRKRNAMHHHYNIRMINKSECYYPLHQAVKETGQKR